MKREQAAAAIDAAFSEAFKNWEATIERDLYPAAFADEYSWLRVKSAIARNNKCLKTAVTQAILNVLAEE